MPSCASTYVGTVAFDERGRPVPIPLFNNKADIVGEVSLTIPATGYPTIAIKSTPALEMIPILTYEEFNSSGVLLKRIQKPLVVGIHNSSVNHITFNGISKVIASAGDAALKFFSGLIGLDLGRGEARRLANPSTQ